MANTKLSQINFLGDRSMNELLLITVLVALIRVKKLVIDVTHKLPSERIGSIRKSLILSSYEYAYGQGADDQQFNYRLYVNGLPGTNPNFIAGILPPHSCHSPFSQCSGRPPDGSY
jgi:hypothetical protein